MSELDAKPASAWFQIDKLFRKSFGNINLLILFCIKATSAFELRTSAGVALIDFTFTSCAMINYASSQLKFATYESWT